MIGFHSVLSYVLHLELTKPFRIKYFMPSLLLLVSAACPSCVLLEAQYNCLYSNQFKMVRELCVVSGKPYPGKQLRGH